jgi:hypothetical protein
MLCVHERGERLCRRRHRHRGRHRHPGDGRRSHRGRIDRRVSAQRRVGDDSVVATSDGARERRSADTP